ncbi:MAG TPA: hypothetical protein VF252_10435 [Gemmatimonadales bacterium]
MTPDVLLYLAAGLGAAVLLGTALAAFRRRTGGRPFERPINRVVDTRTLSPLVRSRVAGEFAPAEQPEVELLLAQYDDLEIERVQLAILRLAKGQLADVARHVAAAREDYRDVLYWASYYEDDPHRLLRELLTHLEESELVTRDDARSVLRATRGGLYADAFEKLCEILLRKETRFTREIYQRVERLGTIVHQPEQLWTRLEKNVVETS